MSDDRALEQVRQDLTDGHDLALAAQLIADALVRRVRRARRMLDEVEQRLPPTEERDESDVRVVAQVEILRDRTAGFEREMGRLSTRIERTMASYEAELQDLADTMGGRSDAP